MDKSCPVVVLRNSKKVNAFSLLFFVCTCVNICSSVRYVDIADAVIILAVPHISCGRSSIGTKISMGIKVLEGYENDASYLS